MKYIITQQGPIDRHAPGTDATDLYPADVLQRLIAEGYVEAETPKRTPRAKAANNDS